MPRTASFLVVCLTIALLGACSTDNDWWCYSDGGACFQSEEACTGPEWSLSQSGCTKQDRAWCSMRPPENPKEPLVCWTTVHYCKNATGTKCNVRD